MTLIRRSRAGDSRMRRIFFEWAAACQPQCCAHWTLFTKMKIFFTILPQSKSFHQDQNVFTKIILFPKSRCLYQNQNQDFGKMVESRTEVKRPPPPALG